VDQAEEVVAIVHVLDTNKIGKVYSLFDAYRAIADGFGGPDEVWTITKFPISAGKGPDDWGRGPRRMLRLALVSETGSATSEIVLMRQAIAAAGYESIDEEPDATIIIGPSDSRPGVLPRLIVDDAMLGLKSSDSSTPWTNDISDAVALVGPGESLSETVELWLLAVRKVIVRDTFDPFEWRPL